jgi:hypothetical protein
MVYDEILNLKTFCRGESVLLMNQCCDSSYVVSLGMKISSKERTLGHCLGGLGSLGSPCIRLLPDRALVCQAAISKC